jgi:hypothetical protein
MHQEERHVRTAPQAGVTPAHRRAAIDEIFTEDCVFYGPKGGNPPRLIGDLNTPAGDISQVFSPTTDLGSLRDRRVA